MNNCIIMFYVLTQCPCELITEDDPGHVEPHEGVIGGVVDLPLCERVSTPGLSAEVRQERPGDHPGIPARPGRGDRRRGAGGEHEAEMCLRGLLL